MADTKAGQEIKEGRKEMPEYVNLTKEDLKELLMAVANAGKAMNPLEQKKYEEEVKKEKHHAAMVLEMGRAEEESIRAKRNSCTHRTDKTSGDSVSLSDANGWWCTQGQVHSNDVISLICLRCSTVWYWKGTPQEREYAVNAEHGLLHYPPPPKERLLPETGII